MHKSNWSFEAGYCKIRTARQKKRLQKEDFDNIKEQTVVQDTGSGLQ
jgi:hypothetical protein